MEIVQFQLMLCYNLYYCRLGHTNYLVEDQCLDEYIHMDHLSYLNSKLVAILKEGETRA